MIGTAARRAFNLKRKKSAFYDTLLVALGPMGMATNETIIKKIAKIRRKGPVDALDVLLACIDFGFCKKAGSMIVLNEVTDEMLR